MKLRFSLRPGNTDAVFRKLEEREESADCFTAPAGTARMRFAVVPVRSRASSPQKSSRSLFLQL